MAEIPTATQRKMIKMQIAIMTAEADWEEVQVIAIKATDLAERARKYGVPDLKPYYQTRWRAQRALQRATRILKRRRSKYARWQQRHRNHVPT